MNPKIKELIRRIESTKYTLERLTLLKELDDEVTKYRKELVIKLQRENR
jgi:hypothetical protein|tara:strand:+ start:899 stop:1045 length:147 start_codon:yes stop_codon:yes gene_type:complete